MDTHDELTVSQVAERSGFAPSALRFYESKGLIDATRSSGGQRRYRRDVLRRLAFIAAGRHVGLTLEELRDALDSLPASRTPNKRDWTKLSARWRSRINDEIAALEAVRDKLDSCIGCGCLSLQRCQISNPDDRYGAGRSGAVYLPEPLHPAP